MTKLTLEEPKLEDDSISCNTPKAFLFLFLKRRFPTTRLAAPGSCSKA